MKAVIWPLAEAVLQEGTISMNALDHGRSDTLKLPELFQRRPHTTSNLDRLASKYVGFDWVHVQSLICGPGRMSFFTRRYVRSHSATWNRFPLRVGEPILGNHLLELGVESTL